MVLTNISANRFDGLVGVPDVKRASFAGYGKWISVARIPA